jgi:hypothetical protein
MAGIRKPSPYRTFALRFRNDCSEPRSGYPALLRRILKAQRHRLIVEAFANPLQRGATSRSREPIMLKATEEEIEKVREYFEWQAPDLEVTFM